LPLSVIQVYKVRWWNEYKATLCGKENVEFFCKTKTKKFTLHNLHTFDKKKEIAIGPSTPIKRESPLSSTKACSKGLTQKECEILELLKDDPPMRQVFLQKILDQKDKDDSGDEVANYAGSTKKPNPCVVQDSRDPYDV